MCCMSPYYYFFCMEIYDVRNRFAQDMHIHTHYINTYMLKHVSLMFGRDVSRMMKK